MLGKKLKKHVNDTVEDEVEYNVSIGKIITSYRKEEFMNNIWTKAQSKDLDKKFKNMEDKFDKKIDDQRKYMDKKFDSIDKRFEAMEEKFDKKIDDQRKYMDKRFDDQTNFMIELFKLNGMKTPEAK